MEAQIDYMRAIEFYNAERVKINDDQSELQVHLLMYEESCELY